MKKPLLIAIILSSYSLAYSAPVIRAEATYGSWNLASTWTPNRLPAGGDTIIIPAGKTVTISDVENSLNNVVLKVYGILKLTNGKLSLDNSSTIIVYVGGSIQGSLSSSEQIRMGNNKIWDGNQPPVTGPQMANSTSDGFIAFSQGGVILPVRFTGYSVLARGKDAFIQWATSEETGSYQYEIERSFDGTSWNTIGSVAAAGNSQTLIHYSYTDRNTVIRTVYYRIKQVDLSGQFSYTPVRSVKPAGEIKADVKIAVMPGNRVLLEFTAEVKEEVTVRFISMSGQLIGQKIIHDPFGQIILSSPSRFNGNCVVSVSNGRDLNIARQVIF